MTDDLTQETEALLTAATPGPWYTNGEVPPHVVAFVDNDVFTDEVRVVSTLDANPHDAALIAAAPTLLRRWLEHDKAQREEIERLREVVDEWKRHVDVLSDDILAYEEHGWCGDGCGLCDDANKARDALDKWKELRDA